MSVLRLTVFYEPLEGTRVRVGTLRRAARRPELFFEYDEAFIERGLELSPFKLPLGAEVFSGDPALFDGLMGLFDDSLPDGWGQLLIDRRARHLGISPKALGPLDRLALVGRRGMGALTYEPELVADAPTVVRLKELASDVEAVVAEKKRVDVERLFTIGGSPHGARPKALVQLDAKGQLHAGVARALEGCTQWLVKFPSARDGAHAGALEHAYALMARAAGIDVPETRLMGGRYFASRRFDRLGARRVHVHTLGGLVHCSHTVPSLGYEQLLTVARQLVGSPGVDELFRRACFNVFAHNRDDHAKNFAFTMSEQGTWSLAPAYDLSFSDGPGGEHWMTVAGSGLPTREHLEQLARAQRVRAAAKVIDEVQRAVRQFPRFADEAGVPSAGRRAVQLRLQELPRRPGAKSKSGG